MDFIRSRMQMTQSGNKPRIRQLINFAVSAPKPEAKSEIAKVAKSLTKLHDMETNNKY
jgi:hypothetical protein